LLTRIASATSASNAKVNPQNRPLLVATNTQLSPKR